MGALAILPVSLGFGLLFAVLVAADGGATAGVLIGVLTAVCAIWLLLIALVIRWWARGRSEIWNVTLAWAVICWFSIYLLPLLLWPRFRHWLGGSLKPWHQPGADVIPDL